MFSKGFHIVFLLFFVQDLREAAVWIAVTHKNKQALELFAREIAPAGTGMGKDMSLKAELHPLH